MGAGFYHVLEADLLLNNDQRAYPATAQIHRAVLHVIEGLQALAGAVGHAGDGVVGHAGIDAGLALDQLVKTVDQAAAAGHQNTVGGDIAHQLGHSSSNITMRTYAHMLEPTKLSIAQTLDDIKKGG